MTIWTHVAALSFVMGLFAVPAPAQSFSEPRVPAEPAPPRLETKACADRDRWARNDTVETDGRGARGEGRSEAPSAADGVICPPPGLDPHIRAPAPHTGSDMPVIPPSEVDPQPAQK